jgi:hypothetical protein
MSADTTGKKPRGRPFQPGNNANPKGRPKGSRNKVSEDYVAALAADFEANGVEVIVRLREEDPRAYIKCVADLVPKDLHVQHDAADAFLALWQGMQGGKLPDDDSA